MNGSGQRHDRTALVLYGSETGSAQDVAEEIGRLTERLRFTTRIADLNSIRLDDILRSTIIIFAISTTGQGEVPGNAQLFWKRLRSVRLKADCFSGVEFTSFGLGDTSYPKFNWAHRKLYNRIKQLGGVPFCERGESDEQHPEGIDGSFLPWAAKLRITLQERFPLPVGVDAIPDNIFLTPKWVVEFEEGAARTKRNVHTGDAMNDEGFALKGDNVDVSKVPTALVPINFIATLHNNKRVTPESHWQDVRLFEFSSENIGYEPGDVMTVFPHNTDSDVEAFLAITGWTSNADNLIHFTASSSDLNPEHNPPPLSLDKFKANPLTLRKLIKTHLDISSIPRRSFFASLAHFTIDETQKDRLLEFTNSEYIDELFDYTTRPRRSILEVLQEFTTVHLPLAYITAIIPTIRGRQFSIASGGAQKTFSSGQARIELLVAIVKYRTVIKKIREGLCTKYLAALQPGATLEAVLCKGGMKQHFDRPAVMVGPGTGIAPLRALVNERVANPQASVEDRQLLFFGGRSRGADFFFEEEWAGLRGSAALDVYPAFSRDQASKLYVQDLILRHSHQVYEALHRGVVYICGSSGKMPLAVRDAIVGVFEKEGGLSNREAQERLGRMEREGRVMQETW